MQCNSCGSELQPDKTRCLNCGSWNTEERINLTEVLSLKEIKVIKKKRLVTGPWDKCFGGGIVITSQILIGGAPGAGKSTLELQIADAVADQVWPVLIIAAEEDPSDIKDRALRLGLAHADDKKILVMPALGEVENLIESIMERNPRLIFLDSLSGLCGESGTSGADIRRNDTLKALKLYAVDNQCPIIVIDHVTKDGELAGRMTTQHAVDTTIEFFPQSKNEDSPRTLRTLKNRNGPAFVKVDWKMTERGLVPIDEDEALPDTVRPTGLTPARGTRRASASLTVLAATLPRREPPSTPKGKR